jgi:hypothetical protein
MYTIQNNQVVRHIPPPKEGATDVSTDVSYWNWKWKLFSLIGLWLFISIFTRCR